MAILGKSLVVVFLMAWGYFILSIKFVQPLHGYGRLGSRVPRLVSGFRLQKCGLGLRTCNIKYAQWAVKLSIEKQGLPGGVEDDKMSRATTWTKQVIVRNTFELRNYEQV